LVGAPSGLFRSVGVAGTASAAAIDVQRDYVIGIGDWSVYTLNPNTYTMTTEGMLIFPCYSTLLQWDRSVEKVIGDLAWDWDCSPDGLTWHFNIVDNAFFCDPANPTDMSHPVTAYDVEFTFMSLQAEDSSRLHSYFPGIIAEFTVINDFEFEIVLNSPYAPIMDSWVGAMILPKYYWEGEDFVNFGNTPPIGSGAFFYDTDGLPVAGYAVLSKNPIWYGTENHGWQIHCDRWILREELSVDVAWLEVNAGVIDVALSLPPSLYVANLQPPTATPDVVGFHQENGFVYELNLNQMSDELREYLGGQYASGSNDQLLLDETVKLAMSCCVDKYGFVEDMLLGLGSYADSLVPPQNPGHYTYPDPDPYDPLAARMMLYEAGWAYRVDGTLIQPTDSDYTSYYPLCKVGGTDPLQFDFITLDNDILWTTSAKYIVSTARLGGFDLQLSLCSINEMNSAWFTANYDVWLWDWVMSVTADPLSTMGVFTSASIGTDQDVFWVSEEYDDLYATAQVTMDPIARLAMTDQLQAMAYEMRGCNCLAYKDQLYAAYVGEWAEASLGDWNNEYYMLPDIWPWWLAMSIYPNENNAPDLFSYPTDVETDVGNTFTVAAWAIDDDSTTVLEYRWFWGDGTKTEWSTSSQASHTYIEDGVYTADVAVREASASNGFADYFMTSKGFTVTARDLSNEAPVIVDMSWTPTQIAVGTSVDFVGLAVDPEGDEIEYTWAFGDGTFACGQAVTHTYLQDGSYAVTLSVTDNVIGAAMTRPVVMSVLIAVSHNDPPLVSVPDFGPVAVRTDGVYTVEAFDPDGDQLLFTWDWGDGTVTYSDTATATHAYSVRGFYTVTVTVSDGVDLPGHEVSDSGIVYVYSGSGGHYYGGGK
jgi:ABC-type oligopeptide transport system substrate-binding subunit/PKD repeat protein